MTLTLINYFNVLIHKLKIRRINFLYLGKNVQIFQGFEFGYTENLRIEDNVVIGEKSFINAHGGVLIKSGTITGPELMIFSVNHIYENSNTMPFSNDLSFKKVVIGDNCWIGGRVFISPGVELGYGCIVAGGSVVTKSFPPLSVIGGNPAKLIKMRDENDYIRMCGNKVYCDFIKRNIK